MPFPKSAPFADPAFRDTQGVRVDTAISDPADLPRPNEAAGFKDLDMLHHRCERHAERLGKLADGCRFLAQTLDDRPTRGVGEGVKDQIQ